MIHDLDRMDLDRLGRFAESASTATTAVARRMFPLTEQSRAAEAVSLLAMYARARLAAMRSTDPTTQAAHLSTCDRIYSQLPPWAQWQVTV